MDQIRAIDRKQEVPHDGIDVRAVFLRGSGCLFGGKILEHFNKVNNVGLLARAHQLVMEGYKCLVMPRGRTD